MSRPPSRPYQVQLTREFYTLIEITQFIRANGFSREFADRCARDMPQNSGGSKELNQGGTKIVFTNISIDGKVNPRDV